MDKLVDRFGRKITYLRLSVTDRCDFRCVYCMAEDMVFVPRKNVLSYEELTIVARAFVELGVEKIRLTGGEPLIRRDILSEIKQIADVPGLKELNLSTNGSHLAEMAPELKKNGITRINISLDSLKPDRFKAMTRSGDLNNVLAGIEAACQQNFQRIKLNAVIMRGRNEDEILDLINFVRARNIDISFIEEMPLGNIGHDRAESFMPSSDIRAIIEKVYPLTDIAMTTGGPSRYCSMADSNSKVGFISPHSNNFCSSCNRVRVTAEGVLLLCLGNENSIDLKNIIRTSSNPLNDVKLAIVAAMSDKPEKHDFDLDAPVQIVRFMNTTGG